MRRSNTAVRFSNSLEHYMWQSDDEDGVAGSAATAATLDPGEPAHRLSDATGPAAAVPPPETPPQSSSSVPPKAAMALPRSNRRFDHSPVLLPSNIHGVVGASRVADMTRHITSLNRPFVRAFTSIWLKSMLLEIFGRSRLEYMERESFYGLSNSLGRFMKSL